MKQIIVLIVYYNASNYNPIVIEFEKPRFEIVETLGDGYALQEEIKEKEQKEEEEISDYLIYRMMCEPFCI